MAAGSHTDAPIHQPYIGADVWLPLSSEEGTPHMISHQNYLPSTILKTFEHKMAQTKA